MLCNSVTDDSEQNGANRCSRPSEVHSTPVLTAVCVDDRIEFKNRGSNRYIKVGSSFVFFSNEVFGAFKRCIPRPGVYTVNGSAGYVGASVPQD